MSIKSLNISFEESEEYIIIFDTDLTYSHAIPDWTKFEKMICPGNIEHGPDIDYCRLGVEIDLLINYFSTIESTDKGVLVVKQSEEKEVKISADGQEIFYISVWHILLQSRCSVFKYSQWVRSNYLPTSDPDRMFYILFSSFVIENFMVTPGAPVDVEVFKKELQLLVSVLNGLLKRIRDNITLTSSSVSNGLTMFSNLVLLLEIDFDRYFSKLRDRVQKESLLGSTLGVRSSFLITNTSGVMNVGYDSSPTG